MQHDARELLEAIIEQMHQELGELPDSSQMEQEFMTNMFRLETTNIWTRTTGHSAPIV
jgi:hypothetical protein